MLDPQNRDEWTSALEDIALVKKRQLLLTSEMHATTCDSQLLIESSHELLRRAQKALDAPSPFVRFG
jgi:hypothetical protein